MDVPLFHVDAFTDRPFSGNPAAVCVLEHSHDDAWMQLLAREMNLSETAFIWPEGGGYRLRWFTPKIEVALCGHATLATAHVLWEAGLADRGRPIAFETKSGRLTAALVGHRIELDFPLTPVEPSAEPAGLADALGVSPLYVARSRFDYLVEVDSEQTLRRMKPDFRRLAAVEARGVIVTSDSARSEFDFVSRFFAPAAGVDEDPVTGSAHCCLADFWGRRLGKAAMVAWQASERGGCVRMRVVGDRVFLGGQAVTIVRGRLAIT